jgi:SWI/SNF-related matrix-associated actin-dependent regulator of chromatin subfamily A member 5
VFSCCADIQLAVAANKEELLEMITHGAEKIINSTEACVKDILLFTFQSLIVAQMFRIEINDDIEAIIQRVEERTAQLNSKYEGLNLEDLSNFKSDSSVQQWEGEDFRTGVSGVSP